MLRLLLSPRARLLLRCLVAALVLWTGSLLDGRPAPHSSGVPPAPAPASPLALSALSRLPPLSSSAAAAPATAAISAESPTCVRPVPNTGACYIEWPVLAASVTVSTDYMISMTVTLDDRLRGYFSGFFTTSLQAPADMLARGFKVNCGAPGAAGNPDLGASYRYLIEARATSGPVTQISGDVSCPADLLHLQLPFLTR